MKDGLIISVLSVLPKNRLARWMGVASRTRWPRALLRRFLRWYVGHYGVNLEECVGGPDDYETIVDFFTRPLRPGVRPVDGDADALVSPVDGKVYAVGTVTGDRIPQGDGKSFSASELVGEGDWEGGAYAVLYLSPKDYHRVHVAREGEARRFRYLPGALWPVFPAATRRVADLFARNERLTVMMGAGSIEYAAVLVGAFGVGRMRVVFDPIATNDGGAGVARTLSPPVPLARGDELGRFEMGSTVVLVFPPGSVGWTIQPGDVVRVGRRIGTVLPLPGPSGGLRPPP